MKNFIVLVKQVPDLTDIRGNLFDESTGNLRRSGLASILNPLDEEALAMTGRAHQLCGQNGKIVILSMGPAKVGELLLQCLGKIGDMAFLLTDVRLAGADTHATALALSLAIKKIVMEVFNNKNNYYIFCGAQSSDGDTAQVPSQVAAALDIPIIPYASGLSLENEALSFVRYSEGVGTEHVVLREMPALITVRDYGLKIYPSLKRGIQNYLNVLTKWSLKDIEFQGKGREYSKTKVIRIYEPAIPERKHKKLTSVTMLAGLLAGEAEKIRTFGEENEKDNILLDKKDGNYPSYEGDIWVFAEFDGKDYTGATRELLSEAHRLAGIIGSGVGVLTEDTEVAETLEADKIIRVRNTANIKNDFTEYSRILSLIIKKHRPSIMLFGATPLGRCLAPGIAYFCGCGLTADCTGLDILDGHDLQNVEKPILRQTRPALGGNIMAEICSVNSFCQMATVRPGVFGFGRSSHRRPGVTIYEDVCQLSQRQERIELLIIDKKRRPDILNTPFIVSGGRGLGSSAAYNELVITLAKDLASRCRVSVEYTGSRAAVDYGFVERGRQVGQSGANISPAVYLAIGISGAIQHMAGALKSRTIVAVNSDPNAPIIRQSDYYISGRAENIIPKLMDIFRKKVV